MGRAGVPVEQQRVHNAGVQGGNMKQGRERAAMDQSKWWSSLAGGRRGPHLPQGQQGCCPARHHSSLWKSKWSVGVSRNRLCIQDWCGSDSLGSVPAKTSSGLGVICIERQRSCLVGKEARSAPQLVAYVLLDLNASESPFVGSVWVIRQARRLQTPATASG